MLTVNNAIEIIRLKVSPDNVTSFLNKRIVADEAVGQLKGFVSADLCQLNEEEWIMFIRWEDMAAVKEAQEITEKMPEISEWVATAKAFISFETVEVKRFFSK